MNRPNRSRYSVNIFHPSDFSRGSQVAFCHALKIAILAKAQLEIMHVAANENDMHWTDFPGVRSTLARWGILPEGVTREEVIKIGVAVIPAARKDLFYQSIRFYAISSKILSI